VHLDDLIFVTTHSLTQETELVEHIKSVGNDQRAAMCSSEMLNLHRITERILKLEGDIAEVGVYLGGSAKIMALASCGKKTIHLFDTFQGIAETTPSFDKVKVGEFRCPLDAVKDYLKEFSQIRYHPGMFPQSVKNDLEILGKKFALVNLDADTYVTTKACLEFFYPRMSRGGVILIHDYHSLTCPGVKPAVEEFMADKPETIFDLWSSQVAITKFDSQTQITQ
jgi:O-methyltransferase